MLLLSDAPTAQTGLARITRDLATRIHANMADVFDVGTVGYGGTQSRSLGFPQYEMVMDNWVVHNLPDVWKDFSQGNPGILMTIWDLSRILWLTRPENCEDIELRKFLQSKPFKKIGYLPMDATGINNKLTNVLRHTAEGFDRVLAYSAWAENILRNTLTPGSPILDNLTFLPHGIDCDVFKPRNRHAARQSFGQRADLRFVNTGKFVTIPDDALLVGVVGTNQPRKDWGLAVATVAKMRETRKVMLWCHIDRLENAWSLLGLLNDCGILDAVVTTVHLPDEVMSYCYSACDVTLAIGLGEGFGFGAAESLACGTPVVAPDYGGGEFIPKEFLVKPFGYRIEGAYSVVRPVMSPTDFATKALEIAGMPTECPEYIRWDVLWPNWQTWFLEGVK